MVSPHESVAEFIGQAIMSDVDVVVLHAHSMSDHLPQDIAAVREAGFDQPIILVTEDDEADQRDAVKKSLRLGASGHLSTRSTGIDMAISSFAFAHEGGTFAAMSLLLADEQEPCDAHRPSKKPAIRLASPTTVRSKE
jgi:hypothetical protein